LLTDSLAEWPNEKLSKWLNKIDLATEAVDRSGGTCRSSANATPRPMASSIVGACLQGENHDCPYASDWVDGCDGRRRTRSFWMLQLVT